MLRREASTIILPRERVYFFGDEGGNGQKRDDQDEADHADDHHHGQGNQGEKGKIKSSHRDADHKGELLIVGHSHQLFVEIEDE